MSEPTTLKAFQLFLDSIACYLAQEDILLEGEIKADESYFGGKQKGMRGRGAGHKTIIFWDPGAGRRYCTLDLSVIGTICFG